MSAESTVGLRVDVEFSAGMRRAVPRMAQCLARHDRQATFFLVAGHSSGRSWLRKLTRPGVLQRWLRIGAWRLAGRAAVWRDLLERCRRDDYAALLKRTVERVAALGHEIGVHGYDHEWWADHVWYSAPQRVDEEIAHAYAAMHRAIGRENLAWASPGWRTTDAVMQSLAARGVPYLAECWGRAPFRTQLADGTVLAIPHLPISVPSAEAMPGKPDAMAAERVAAACAARPQRVCCLHDYHEGLIRPQLLEKLLEAFEQRGLVARTLVDASRAWRDDAASRPVCRLVRRSVAGFVGAVSVQDEEIPECGR